MYKDKDDVVTKDLDCPTCNKKYCITCQANHEKYTCEEFQKLKQGKDNDTIAFLLKQRGVDFQQCPRCLNWVQRNGGCSMLCFLVCKL